MLMYVDSDNASHEESFVNCDLSAIAGFKAIVHDSKNYVFEDFVSIEESFSPEIKNSGVCCCQRMER